ncbi:uncharacterized protein L969DRAFT_46934 [Mixia osmundae IAM 14324]|uniref:Pectate lyase superfamily protein domain-containing protein n=1 Tax=Mixia osmundae (strain CBS 9802 / IAM 14324 / JCM 22182 / KY 12970) TaxID=764103 RepID=G7DU58_MIXOS|nr:uncharacterized protein L969DRAFT_46934 [Mixia osmundae IAM 14324]KEI40984.1 hypothetical protein L969DRAFT_46934 [Mixia osmundae IAM 14324]GAA94118.1 hypothetical protein E5Q_00765 [Mixia osmundae IAM 14324]
MTEHANERRYGSTTYQSSQSQRNIDKIPDFSFCGYAASERPLPDQLDVVTLLQPSGDSRDRTTDIQRALDAVHNVQPRTTPAVVLLRHGEYVLDSSASILIHSNVVLRGEASSTGQLTKMIIRGPPREVFVFGRSDIGRQRNLGKARILDNYVPVGSRIVRVDDVAPFATDGEVVVERNVSREWIAAMDMDKLVRDGKQQTWLQEGTKIYHRRKVSRVVSKDSSGGLVELDIPLVDSLDTAYRADGQLIAVVPPEQTQQAGLEGFALVLSPSWASVPLDGTPNFLAVSVKAYVQDIWLRDLLIIGFRDGIVLENNARRITLLRCRFIKDAPSNAARGLPSEISLRATQVLIKDCSTDAVHRSDSYSVVTQAKVTGPNAILNWSSTGQGKLMLSPHQRWATGLLVDNCQATKIEFGNRGIMGSGHGWTCGASVVWNSRSDILQIQRPPLSQNYAIGCTVGQLAGGKTNDGLIESLGHRVLPASLYTAQLEARIGVDRAHVVLSQ